MSERIRLVDLHTEPLSIDEVYRSVLDDRAGAVDVFVGTVRDHDHQRDVTALEYSAHPTVVEQMRKVAEAVADRHEAIAFSVVHRVGDLRVGDLAVVAAVSAAHRGQAFDACRALVDDLKSQVPIWKHQVFSDGTTEWVGTP
ncbi:molybdenum cofactor biosynthesis protein MoaE [Solicola sp. PLA-1-18]|uniref:molybdenum cofactor biosynthesis protein MoaE n=1 Tax=Solicola sp. PLA-1-18 TaxID=3380532 RepID=UPI003B8088CC